MLRAAPPTLSLPTTPPPTALPERYRPNPRTRPSMATRPALTVSSTLWLDASIVDDNLFLNFIGWV